MTVKNMKVGFISLGCSKNLVDTEVMLRKLYDAGFEITPDETEAEIIIINTCGFIESAKQESIDTILEMETTRFSAYTRYTAVLCIIILIIGGIGSSTFFNAIKYG